MIIHYHCQCVISSGACVNLAAFFVCPSPEMVFGRAVFSVSQINYIFLLVFHTAVV